MEPSNQSKILLTLFGLLATVASHTLALTVNGDLSMGHLSSDRAAQQIFVKEIVERHGSDNAHITAQLIEELHRIIETMVKAGDNDRAQQMSSLRMDVDDQFGLSKLSSFDLYKLYDTVGHFLTLTREDDDPARCHRYVLDNYVEAINSVYGNDLREFVVDELKPMPKFHEFLLHYGKQTVRYCLRHAVQLDYKQTAAAENSDKEIEMDIMLAQDGRPRASDLELLDRAKRLDLLAGRFDGRQMLDSIESYLDYQKPRVGGRKEAHLRLLDRIQSCCWAINLTFGTNFVVYNLARLLIPRELSSMVSLPIKFQKLYEYHRLCLPFANNQPTKTMLTNNLKRNMSPFARHFAS